MPFRNPFAKFQRWRSLQALVQALPVRQLLSLAAAIFSLFAMMGPITDLLNGARQPTIALVHNTLFSGTIAILYAFGSMRRNWWLFAGAVALQVTWSVVLGRLFDALPPLAPERVGARIRLDASIMLAGLVASYTFFLLFINRTAARYLRAQAEILLAREIHRVLVPPISRTVGGYEFAGYSIASGEVGGDLVDVVARRGGWIGYVADVAGHGVSSGLVMGMFKSALHTRLLAGGSLASLLRDLNDVLVPLKQSSMYVTVACVRVEDGGPLEFAVAGHLPILVARRGAGEIEEITTPQIPIGMFADYTFTSSALACGPGDLLVLLTDGLVEVFDREDRELGLDGMKRIIAAMRDRPLDAIGRALVDASRAHGAQLDDQTVLLIRKRDA